MFSGADRQKCKEHLGRISEWWISRWVSNFDLSWPDVQFVLAFAVPQAPMNQLIDIAFSVFKNGDQDEDKSGKAEERGPKL